MGGCWDGHLKVRWGDLRMLIWLVERLVRMLAPLLVLVVIVVVGVVLMMLRRMMTGCLQRFTPVPLLQSTHSLFDCLLCF